MESKELQKNKVSMVLPVYNMDKWLPRCMDSLLGQTYQNFEIVAIDDGSTDNTLAVLEEYSTDDDRIRVYSYEHSNISVVRNASLGLIECEYVTFLDADDWCEPDYLEKLLDLMKNEGSDLSVCGCTEIHSRKKIERYIEDFDPLLKKEENRAENLILFYAERNILSACWSKMYKTEIIRKNNIRFSERSIVNNDIIFNMEYLLCCNKVSMVRLPLYNYVKYASSLSSKRDPDAIRTVESVVFEKTRILAVLDTKEDEKQKRLRHWEFRAIAFSCYREMKDPGYIPFKERYGNSLLMVNLIKSKYRSGTIDRNRIKPRTMLYVRFLFLMNRFTLALVLIPMHLFSLIRGGSR